MELLSTGDFCMIPIHKHSQNRYGIVIKILFKKVLFILSASLLLTCGCALDPSHWKTPNFAHPGTLEVQRHNMLLCDPLPSTTMHDANRNGYRPREMTHPWTDLSLDLTDQKVQLNP